MDLLRNVYVEVIIAGIAAGAWPLVMQRSGLIGAPVALLCGLVALVTATVLIFASGGAQAQSQPTIWWIALVAGLLSALPFLILGDVIGRVSSTSLSTLYIILLIVQISIPAIFYAVVHGINLKQGIGFILAIAAALLLS